jgi:hypothetical protein
MSGKTYIFPVRPITLICELNAQPIDYQSENNFVRVLVRTLLAMGNNFLKTRSTFRLSNMDIDPLEALRKKIEAGQEKKI